MGTGAVKEVIVAGGLGGLAADADVLMDSVEILSVEGRSWRSGPALPDPLSSLSFVNYGGSGVISGGLGQSGSRIIFQVTWTENLSKMQG